MRTKNAFGYVYEQCGHTQGGTVYGVFFINACTMGSGARRESAAAVAKCGRRARLKNPRHARDGRDLHPDKKGGNRLPVWTAYSRGSGKIVAYVIGRTKECAVELYNKARLAVGTIRHIYTDGNSCYAEMFKKIGIDHLHSRERGKSQTHLIESTNRSIRDNLARFNRKSKRYSKRLDMLDDTLQLFFIASTLTST
jgi:IS1 family transposase